MNELETVYSVSVAGRNAKLGLRVRASPSEKSPSYSKFAVATRNEFSGADPRNDEVGGGNRPEAATYLSMKLPDEFYKSLTWDRGKELADHQRLGENVTEGLKNNHSATFSVRLSLE